VTALRERFGDDLRVVFRHAVPPPSLTRATPAAIAVEAAGEQGKAWDMIDALFARDTLEEAALAAAAREIGLDVERWERQRRDPAIVGRVHEAMSEAARLGVVGTPTFYVDGVHHEGAVDVETLGAVIAEAVRVAKEGRAADVAHRAGRYGIRITVGPHGMDGDLPAAERGEDTGPSPHDLVVAALGACSSMAILGVAVRDGLDVTGFHVHVEARKAGDHTSFVRRVTLPTSLDEKQRERVLAAVERCPISRLLRTANEVTVEAS